jgi:hypothetical protein
MAGFADIVKPLHNLTIRAEPFVWSDSQEDAKPKDKLVVWARLVITKG